MTAVLARSSSATSAVAPLSRDELIRSHLPLVQHLVREVGARVPSHVLRDDLESAAMYALAASALSFNAALGTSFAAYASMRIRGALTDELRSMDWASRSVRAKAKQVDLARRDLAQRLGTTPTTGDVAAELALSAAQVSAIEADAARAEVASLQALPFEAESLLASAADGPESFVLRTETLAELRVAIERLPHRLRFVVTEYFLEQRRMTEIAAELGVTESRVSQLRSEALVKLRAIMRPEESALQAS
jgi:RNA polymerase sigma factor for flagellar operon FliA